MENEERKEVRERVLAFVERFRQRGATTPDKALTLAELGLPFRFEYLMRGRLGKLGIFVEVEGKYYLSEERLKQVEERLKAKQVLGGSRRKWLTLRIIRIVCSILLITLVLVNLFVSSLEIRVISSILLVALLGISILQLYYLTKASKRIHRI